MRDTLDRDLDHVLEATEPLWVDLRGSRILLTGGTGFMGCWLLESLLHAQRRLGLDTQVVVPTRNPLAFARKAPHLAEAPAVRLVQADVLRFPPLEGSFTHLIHGATDASAKLLAEDPKRMFDTIVEGTRQVLEFASLKSVARALFLSSGAIYGRQPAGLTHVAEDHPGAPDCADARSAYAEGKRAAETLCALHSRQYGLPVSIARCFAFVGPYLPLDAHFAIGNFIRDGLAGGPIRVLGDGTPRRSYLYASDLAIWLWHLLLRGTPGRPYNVGSEETVSIAELAARVGHALGGVPSRVEMPETPGKPTEWYVPSVARIRTELGLAQTIPLEEGIRRTAAWHA